MLLRHWAKDLQLGLYILLTLQLFRLVLIAIFHSHFAELNPATLARVLATGLRFDLSTSAVWLLTFPTALLLLFFPVGRWLDRARLLLARLYVVVAMIIFGTDLVYFSEYNDQFEQHVFGLAYDDTTAILLTVWKNYHPIPVLIGIVIAIALNLRWVRGWLAWSPDLFDRIAPRTAAARAVACVAVFFLFVAMARGSLGKEPILLKHAFVTQDLFLNHTVVNPFTALHATLDTKWQASRAGGVEAFWPSGDLRSAARAVRASRGLPGDDMGDVDEAVRVQAHGHRGPAPRHIFVILMESQDGWPVLPQYRGYGFSPRIAALADRGLYFPHFLPSADGTIGSITALITGLPLAGVQINYEPSALTPFPSSLPATFKRLGYKTRFFYGGLLGWQRLDSFAIGQGFDEIYGGGNMATPGAPVNEWGVADSYLYDFMLKKLEEDPEPSLNFVMTTSNHPPYDLDLKALGFPVHELPAALHATKSDTLKVLGHLWYADREVGRFVEEQERRQPGNLFAITGDHTTRLQIRFDGSDGVFESLAVPLVLYGPKVLQGVHADSATPGSHIDLPPTLVELTAPAGFSYYTFGRDLQQKGTSGYGFGYQFMVGRDFIATDAKEPAIYGFPGGSRPPLPADFGAARTDFNALKALSWQRARKGPQLP